MPLFQPSNITPSSFAGVGGGTIDANDNVSITWQVNGNEPMTAFKIDIYQTQNNVQVQVGTSGFKSLSTPFYPTDNKGNPNYYTFEPNATWSSLALPGQTISNGNEYTLQITQWWGNSPTLSSTTLIQQISQSVFITRAKPSLDIRRLEGTAIGATVNVVSLELSAIYQQADGDNAEWVRWQFYQTDENGENAVLLDDTGVVNTQVFSYTLDNMFNGNKYKIVCTAQSENGVQVKAEQDFAVSYELPNIIGQFSVDCSNRMSNLLSWKDIAVETGDSILGTASGNYNFNNGNLVLPNNSSVVWNSVNEAPNSLNIGTPWTLAWKGIAESLQSKTQNTPSSKQTTYQSHNLKWETLNSPSEASRIIYDDTNKVFWEIANDFSINCVSNDGTVLSTYTAPNVYSYRLYDFSINIDKTRLVAVGTESDSNQPIYHTFLFSIDENFNLTLLNKIGGTQYTRVQFRNTVNYEFIAVCAAIPSQGRSGVVDAFHLGGNLDELAPTTCVFFPYSSSTYFALSQDDSTFAIQYGENPPTGLTPINYIGVYDTNYFSTFQRRNTIYLGQGVNTNGIALNKNGTILAERNNVYNVSGETATNLGTYYSNAEVKPIMFDISGNYLYSTYNDGTNTTIIETVFNGNSFQQNSAQSFIGNLVENRTTLGNILVGNNYGIIGIYSYSISVDNFNGNIYSVTATAHGKISGELTPKVTFTNNSYTISGTTNFNENITFNISVVYFGGAVQQTLLQVDENITVRRYQTKLQFVIGNSSANFDISLNANIVLFSINENSITVYFNGETTGTTQSISITQEPITSIQLVGEQTTSWVVVESGTKTIPSNYNPIWSTENGTQFLTNFGLNSLEAGQLSVAEPKLEIYRENLQTGEVQKIGKTDLDINQLRDYSWITGEQYKYTAYALLGNVYTGVQTFNPYPICKRQNFYLLLETVQDGEQQGVYHVINSWRFGANISAGSVSNNNSPNFLTNFTPYRLKQPSTRNSKSGTLQALISNVKNGKYADTVEQMERLYDISNSLNTFFLKDMKGNLYMVSIANAITQTINTKSSVQEVTVSIPWEETGSAEGVSIIQTPEDNGWVGDNQIANARLATKINGDNIAQELGLPDGVSIDFVDGQLYVSYPDGYQGTTFSLDENGNLVATTPEQQQQPKLYLDKGTVKLKTEN